MTETMFAETREGAGPDETYRPMSGLAVAALVGGFLSAAALFGPVMWFVAGLTIVTSVAALRHVARMSRQGAGLARAGLGLAVVFLAASISYSWWQDYTLRAQAQRVADMWVNAILSGDVRVAHQLTLGPTSMLPSVVAPPRSTIGSSSQSQADRLEETYRQNPALASHLEIYRKHKLIAKVVEIGHVKHGAIASRQITAQVTDNFQQTVGLQYELRYEENGHPETTTVSLSLSRPLRYGRHISGWRVNPVVSEVGEGPTEEPPTEEPPTEEPPTEEP